MKVIEDQETKDSRYRWNINTGFVELKMPKTSADAQASFELAVILMNMVLRQCYIPRTTMLMSRKRSRSTACTYLDYC
jgi:hypothetical protein